MKFYEGSKRAEGAFLRAWGKHLAKRALALVRPSPKDYEAFRGNKIYNQTNSNFTYQAINLNQPIFPSD
jgi:hypothetical protein